MSSGFEQQGAGDTGQQTLSSGGGGAVGGVSLSVGTSEPSNILVSFFQYMSYIMNDTKGGLVVFVPECTFIFFETIQFLGIFKDLVIDPIMDQKNH